MTRHDASWRRSRLDAARLYLCVGLQPREQGSLGDFLDAVLASGVDVVQLRDKVASRGELRVGAATFREAADAHDALFILNDDPALAAEVDADGVHVGQEDATPGEARAAVGHERLVGRSTHTTWQVDRALNEDCDYFAVGPVHATPTKAGRTPIGLGPVRHAADRADSRPWFVTGGMGPTTADAVFAAGGRRLVVVRAITEAPEPAAVASQLAGALRDAAQVGGSTPVGPA